MGINVLWYLLGSFLVNFYYGIDWIVCTNLNDICEHMSVGINHFSRTLLFPFNKIIYLVKVKTVLYMMYAS